MENLGLLELRFEIEIPNFELEDLGFDVAAIDLAIEADSEEEAEPQPEAGPAVSRVGDLWSLRKHRVHCADATRPESHARLMAGTLADGVFTDCPFGCGINGFVAGEGRHREFVMGSGDMSESELATFFEQFNRSMAKHVKPGAVIYEGIDWRSRHLLLDAVNPVFGKLINLTMRDAWQRMVRNGRDRGSHARLKAKPVSKSPTKCPNICARNSCARVSMRQPS
ncbi:MAG: hypothetical protein ABI395_07245 [Sphingobium sp.]